MDVLMAGGKGKSASAFQTPPPTVNGPTPKSKSKETEVPKGASGVKVDLKKRLDPNEVARTQGKDPPATEAAKLARLRRLCEKKPSGKCHVPEELHKRWLHGSLQDREALVEELEAAHWSKDHLFEKNKFQSVYQSMLLWNGTYVFFPNHSGFSQGCFKLFWHVSSRTCSSPGLRRPSPRPTSWLARRRGVGSQKRPWIPYSSGARF